VYVYTLTPANGGTWTVTIRDANVRVVAGAGLTSAYSNGRLTLATASAAPTKTSDLTNDGSDGTSTYVEANELATIATSGSYNDASSKPQINGVTLAGDKSFDDLGTYSLTNIEIDNIINSVV
jgi:hypothetical protein